MSLSLPQYFHKRRKLHDMKLSMLAVVGTTYKNFFIDFPNSLTNSDLYGGFTSIKIFANNLCIDVVKACTVDVINYPAISKFTKIKDTEHIGNICKLLEYSYDNNRSLKAEFDYEASHSYDASYYKDKGVSKKFIKNIDTVLPCFEVKHTVDRMKKDIDRFEAAINKTDEPLSKDLTLALGVLKFDLVLLSKICDKELSKYPEADFKPLFEKHYYHNEPVITVRDHLTSKPFNNTLSFQR